MSSVSYSGFQMLNNMKWSMFSLPIFAKFLHASRDIVNLLSAF